MTRDHRPAILGVLAAIAITTGMDATGMTAFSALPLFPLAGLFWFLQRFSRAEIGLVIGDRRSYSLAVGYPVVVLGTITIVAVLAGAVDASATDWNKAFTNVALMSTTGVLMGILTEEGFFRGWLWASLRRAGHSDRGILLWSTLAFTLWHVSAITLDTGFDVPAAEVPIYLVNAALLGAVFGMLRQASGSIVVPSVCHALWNGLDYPLFGFGERVGALGIRATEIFGPEVGALGVGVNLAAAVGLWLLVRSRFRASG